MAPLFAQQMGHYCVRPGLSTRDLPTAALSCPGHGTKMWQNPPWGANKAHTSWTHLVDMQHAAPKVYTPGDLTASGS